MSTNENNSTKGSVINPYTEEEMNTMMDEGTWTGGYVEGMGYVGDDFTAWGSSGSDTPDSESSDSWDTSEDNEPETPSPSGGGGGGIPPKNDSSGGNTTETGNTNTSTSYSIENAISHLVDNAYPTYIKGKCGHCAAAVRQALEAGGLSTEGRPNSACDYDDYLPTLGFYEVDKNNYVPIAGDIIVLEAVEGHSHGHIAMYSGSNWISDFVQSDMWGGSAYRNKAEYTLFRK